MQERIDRLIAENGPVYGLANIAGWGALRQINRRFLRRRRMFEAFRAGDGRGIKMRPKLNSNWHRRSTTSLTKLSFAGAIRLGRMALMSFP